MARRNDSWGIEVGANAIKAMRLARSGKDVELVDYEILPFKQVLTTPDVNVDEAIQVNLDSLLSKQDLSKSTVVVSVPGHLAFARFAKLPPVDPKKIPDIVRFEAVQQIPFPIEQVEWDYQVFQQEDSPDVEVGIFAITKERVMNFLSNYRHVGLHVDALTLSPLAVYNAFAYENRGVAENGASESDVPGGDVDGTIYMDIGTQSTDLIIVESGGIWLRTLPIGGNNFTEALVKAFKLSFAKAEKLKREAGTSKYARQIFQAMRPVFADLVQEMQRSLGYYQSLNRDAELKRLVGVGSTFRLPGLQKFLKQQLQMEVVRPDGYKRISVEGRQAADFAENALSMATAYGLALQGLGLETVSANVLPQHILKARMWKAKQPWIAAAAACIAGAAGLAGARVFMESSTFTEAVEESRRQGVESTITRAQNLVSEWQSSQGTDPRQRIENLRRILDYRDLWPKLIQDVSAAAAAMGPDPALLTANYEKIAAIPPAQRARFYIEDMQVQYLPEPAPAAGAAAPSAEVNRLGGDFAVNDFFAENKAPRFEITVTGTTPYADAVRFVSQRFIGWLQENAERADRPYRIVVNPRSAIVRRWTVQPTAEGGRDLAGTNRNPSNWGGPPPGYDMGLPPGYNTGMPPSGYNRGGTVNRGDVEAMLPDRPLADENVTLTGFEIRWVVELVRPAEARQAEDARPTAPDPQPQASRPQASATGQPADTPTPNTPDTPDSPDSPDTPQQSDVATVDRQEVPS